MERSFSDKISARLGVNYFPYDYSATEDDIDYDFELDLMTLGAFLGLAKEERRLQEDLDSYEFYPNISIGFNYRF